LAGAALGEAGLKQKTGLAMAALMIAANLPDIDALGLLFGENLAWRRGWTHGPIALALMPIALVGALVAFDRWQGRRGTRPAGRLPVRPGWLLALAYIGVISHPLLDFLNTYGVRCLMPFSERWFYGNTLFIIDVWMWTALAIGIAVSRQRRSKGRAYPNRAALASIIFVTLYTGAMALAGRAAEAIARKDALARGLPVAAVLASPVPIDPFRRDMLLSTGTHYQFGQIRWTPGARLSWKEAMVPINMADPAIALAAARHKPTRDFLYWSRFPHAEVTRSGGEAIVTIRDARYSNVPRAGFVVRSKVREALPPAR
jgi:inner membrane protein